ncbi:HD-GYP domain-containing protein [Azohydromonas sediminis]|uniref:HD-GYP domain-containing protein n=1 Tax=Azohydromonas sediminis TaxID=2259674 RepID=UPI000E6546E5|nr:HD domain-containing phosphohydrolase [Azohydromonas sediminis]
MAYAPLAALRDRITVGAPLPFNVRDADGTLLLAREQVLRDERELDSLFERGTLVDLDEVYTPAERIATAPREELPRLWEECFDRVDDVLRRCGHAHFREALDDASAPVAALVERDPDLALFQVLRADANPLVQYGVNHSMHTAIVCRLVAQRLGWDADSTQRVFKAALTMNVSMLELQGTLAFQGTPPTRSQREQILSHPQRSVEMLRQSGITDREWLDAVLQHHETPDGAGYPQGLTEIGDLAQLIRRADVYTAKLSPRAGREAISADRAGREMFMSEPGHPMVAAMVKEFGLYPPGCFVMLASGEIGMVVKRGPAVNNPVVAVMTTAKGEPCPEPIRRDTSFPAYAVKSVLPARHLPVRVQQEMMAQLLV